MHLEQVDRLMDAEESDSGPLAPESVPPTRVLRISHGSEVESLNGEAPPRQSISRAASRERRASSAALDPLAAELAGILLKVDDSPGLPVPAPSPYVATAATLRPPLAKRADVLEEALLPTRCPRLPLPFTVSHPRRRVMQIVQNDGVMLGHVTSIVEAPPAYVADVAVHKQTQRRRQADHAVRQRSLEQRQKVENVRAHRRIENIKPSKDVSRAHHAAFVKMAEQLKSRISVVRPGAKGPSPACKPSKPRPEWAD